MKKKTKKFKRFYIFRFSKMWNSFGEELLIEFYIDSKHGGFNVAGYKPEFKIVI